MTYVDDTVVQKFRGFFFLVLLVQTKISTENTMPRCQQKMKIQHTFNKPNVYTN